MNLYIYVCVYSSVHICICVYTCYSLVYMYIFICIPVCERESFQGNVKKNKYIMYHAVHVGPATSLWTTLQTII